VDRSPDKREPPLRTGADAATRADRLPEAYTTLRTQAVEAALAEARAFQAAAYQVLLDRRLDGAARGLAMQRLLDRARKGQMPELCCRALERGLVDVVLGRNREAGLWEAWVEEVVRREAAA
jgi:hypothetical protein